MIVWRTEKDLLGEKQVPAEAYYGVQTARAMDNFQISGVPINHYPSIIRAFAMVKMASARANHEAGFLSEEILRGIEGACAELLEGKLHDQFLVDVFQGGAGTSTNMAANEVIANRTLELLGHKKGEYRFCDPHDHVNLSQSTNDAYPTALRVAMVKGNVSLADAVNELADEFERKGGEFEKIIKMGRTQLQDAVPMTLGQEFHAWAQSLRNEVWALDGVRQSMEEVNMGGTAIGTGLNAVPGFAEACVRHLAEISGLNIRLAENLVEATQDTQSFVIYSSALKSLAIKMSKVCNDLRLLSSGPRCGLNEINLPPMQPGSSIMPGKVNPVIPEVVNQVCFRVIGSDLTVTLAAESGQLQLNVMEPVIAACVFESQMLLVNAARCLRKNCVVGITANPDICRRHVEQSIGLVTALNPALGYELSTMLAAEAQRTGRGIVELVLEKELLTPEQLEEMLDPMRMAGGRMRV